MSFPERFVRIIRSQKVTVKALDENGTQLILTGVDEMAKRFCHELEHLDSQIFLDKALEEIKVEE